MEETMTAATAGSGAHASPLTPADRKAAGKKLRDRVPRDAHAGWRAHAGRADPIGIRWSAPEVGEAVERAAEVGRRIESSADPRAVHRHLVDVQ